MTEIRFSKRNLFLPVSFEQFHKTADALLVRLYDVREDFDMYYLLDEAGIDGRGGGYGGTLTWGTLELDDRVRREIYQLSEMDWLNNAKVSLFVKTPTPKPYMIVCSHNKRSDQKAIRFYGQSLDPTSREILLSFWK